MRLAGLIIILLALAPSANAGSNGPPYDYGHADTTDGCAFQPIECDPTFTSDPTSGRIRGAVSISTPLGGTAPGWGSAGGFGELYASRRIDKPAKVVRYLVRIKANFIVNDGVSLGEGDALAHFNAEAIHQDCLSGCKVTISSREMTKSTFGYVTLPLTITSKHGSVPAGDVSIAVQIGAGAQICCEPVRFFYGPPFIFPGGPPGLGRVDARVNAVVQSISRV
jgi:hypothetical protein